MSFKGKDTSKEELIAFIFDQYRSGLVSYAVQFVDNQKRAEDIVQDVLVKIWEKEGIAFDEQIALKTYLYRSVRNACINDLNKLDTLRYTVDIIQQEIQDEKSLVFDESILTELRFKIDQLPQQTRNVVKCVFMEGKKYQQVADELGISINTVKTLLRTGVKSLRKDYEGRDDLFYTYLMLFAMSSLADNIN